MRRLRRRPRALAPVMRPAERYLAAGAVEARRHGSAFVGTEHVLAALTRDPQGEVPRRLRELGVSVEALAESLRCWLGPVSPRIDAEALASLGIDLDAVSMRLEEAFGPDALEQTSAACLGVAPRLKRALEAAVAHADTAPLRDLDILVGLLGVPDCAAARALAALGITIEDVQARLPA